MLDRTRLERGAEELVGVGKWGNSETRKLSNTSDCKRALGRNMQSLNTANRSTCFLIDPSDQCLNQLEGGVQKV